MGQPILGDLSGF